MDANSRVAWNLRRLRTEQGMSQDDLAFAAGIERAYLGYLERGTKNPTVATLEKIARALERDISEMFAFLPHDAQPLPPLKAGRKKS